MTFQIILSPEAKKQLVSLQQSHSHIKCFKAVSKALRLLSSDPRHPGLHTHEFTELTRKLGFKVFEAYAENQTPGAYRIFWQYGPAKNQISIIAILPHP